MGILKNKIIIVTGGNGLLGKEILKNINLEGGIPICSDINLDNESKYDQFFCDVSSEDSVEKLIKYVLKKYGKIDGLVNNAYPKTSDWNLDFEKIKLSSWRKNIDLQLNSSFTIIQKVTKHMKESKTGSIVNMSSIYGLVGPNFKLYKDIEFTMPAPYSAIKGGLINFTRYLASYYGKHNLRINCVSPGGIFNNQNKNFVQNYCDNVPLGRMGNPDDISPTVVFLLSNSSKYITGQNIIIDGGYTTT